MTIRKTLCLGSAKEPRRTPVNIHIWVEVKNDGELSISGVIGAKASGNAAGSCGQVLDSINAHLDGEEITFAPGWDHDKVFKFLKVWHRWHLNHMRAGSPKQMAWLEDNPIPAEEYAYPKSHYTVALNKLKAAGLNPDLSCDKDGNYTETILTEVTRNLHVHHASGIKVGIIVAVGPDPVLLAEFGSSPYNTQGYVLVNWMTEPGAHWVHIGDLRLGGTGAGYKYGSKWLKEALPQTVYNYLAELPETDIPCPWSPPWQSLRLSK